MIYSPTFGEKIIRPTVNNTVAIHGNDAHSESYLTSADIPNYNLPIATSTTLGGIKLGIGLVDVGDGVINAAASSGISSPGTTVDKEILRWSGTTGDAVYQTSGVIIDDSSNVLSAGDLVAYATSSPTGSFWDNLPAATTTTLGGIKLDAVDSVKFLRGDGTWQTVAGGTSSQWNDVSGGIAYNAGNVIIGQSNGSAQALQIYKASSTSNHIAFGNSEWWVGNYNTGDFRIYRGATAQLYINSTGNVGLGITTPWTRLLVKSATNVHQFAIEQDNANAGTYMFSDSVTGDFIIGRYSSAGAIKTDQLKLTNVGGKLKLNNSTNCYLSMDNSHIIAHYDMNLYNHLYFVQGDDGTVGDGYISANTLNIYANPIIVGNLIVEQTSGSAYITAWSHGTGITEVQYNMFNENGTYGRKYFRLGKASHRDYVEMTLLNDARTAVSSTPMIWDYLGRIGTNGSVPVVSLDIGGNQLGLPSNSGSSITGMVRIGLNDHTWGGTELNFGISNDDTIGYAAWIQAQTPQNYSQSRPLYLNPNGGDVKIGANLNVTGDVVAYASNTN